MEKINFQQLKRLLPSLRKNVFLKNYTTFKIGGKAKYFFVVKSAEDLTKAIFLAKRYNLPFFILGGGSNLLVSDRGYRGLVIKMKNEKLKIKNYNSKFKIISEAGAPLTKLVSQSLKIGATGLEWAAGIPGTLGGAIRGNAGAFGKSIANVLKEVLALEITNKSSKIRKFKKKDCKFNYRDSIFKRKKNLLIISAQIQLKKGNKKEIKKILRERIKYRKKRHPLNFPSAGSIFKNKKLKIKNKRLLGEFLQFKEFNKKGEIPAGFLIEKSGLKGKKVGKVQVSEKHPNFIVNLGNGKARDVRKLIEFTKKKVKSKFGIELEEEICFLGFKK